MSALPSFTFLTLGLLMNSCTIMHFLGPHRICIPHRRHTSISHFLLPKKSGLLHHYHHFCRVCCCRVCYSSRTIIIFYRMSCPVLPRHSILAIISHKKNLPTSFAWSQFAHMIHSFLLLHSEITQLLPYLDAKQMFPCTSLHTTHRRTRSCSCYSTYTYTYCVVEVKSKANAASPTVEYDLRIRTLFPIE